MRTYRRTRMRRTLVFGISMFALAAASFPNGPAWASCAAPYLKVTDKLVLERGATITIEGRGFAECQDIGSCSVGLGCDSCEEPEPAEPSTILQLLLVQGDREWILGTEDAQSAEDDHLGWVRWIIEVPSDARPGRAKLVPDLGQPVRIEIR